jgi:hypothetical protein
MLTLRRPLLVAVAITLALVATACSDGDGASSTTADTGVESGDDVVFGSGELPETIPAEFPLPAGSSVGSTMVVSSSGFTEVIVRINAEQGLTAQFFDQALVASGFSVDRSAAEENLWLIEFSRDEAKGTIEITEPARGISQAVIRYNVP